MITGVVDANREATVRLWIRGPHGQEQEVETILDTGFNGSLALPPSIISELGLSFRTTSRVTLGNGMQVRVNVYTAVIVWDGEPITRLIEAAETEPLLGKNLLAGHDVFFEAVIGGRVTITARA